MTCDKTCPTNCRYKTCHIKNGTCFGCVAGYQGTFCQAGIFRSFLSLGKNFDGYYFHVYLQKTILNHLSHLVFCHRSAFDVICRSFIVINIFSKTSGKFLPKLGLLNWLRKRKNNKYPGNPLIGSKVLDKEIKFQIFSTSDYKYLTDKSSTT